MINFIYAAASKWSMSVWWTIYGVVFVSVIVVIAEMFGVSF